MRLLHIKLKNGEDLLGQEDGESTKTLTIVAPISIKIDPSYGIMGMGWCQLSDTNMVELNKSDVLFYNHASKRGYKYYEEFAHKFVGDDLDESEEGESMSDNELEEIFSGLLESKSATKH